jgi:hypothetical protein
MPEYFDNSQLLNSIKKESANGNASNGNVWVYFAIGVIVITTIVVAVNYDQQLKNAQKQNGQLQRRINYLEYFS